MSSQNGLPCWHKTIFNDEERLQASTLFATLQLSQSWPLHIPVICYDRLSNPHHVHPPRSGDASSKIHPEPFSDLRMDPVNPIKAFVGLIGNPLTAFGLLCSRTVAACHVVCSPGSSQYDPSLRGSD